MRLLIQSIFLLVLSFQAAFAQGTDHHESEAASFALTSEVSSVAAGDIFSVALTVTPAADGKSLWQIPLPQSSLEFVSPVQRPAPELIQVGDSTEYGYSGPVTLLMAVAVPPDYTKETITYSLDVSWPVCFESCKDENVSLEFTLGVGATHYDAESEDFFAQVRSKMPEYSFWSAEMQSDNDEMLLLVHMSAEETANIEDVSFFPYAGGVLSYGAGQSYSVKDDGLYISAAREPSDPMPASLDGILSIIYTNGDSLNVIQDASPSATLKTNVVTVNFELTILELVFYALVGGLILNLMPCVFPILSLKALALMRSHDSHRSEGWAYTAGIVSSFILIALAIVSFRAGGELVGWGFQLQSPIFVAMLVFIMVAVGLSLSGLYSINLGIEGAGQSLTESRGPKGSFFTGVLAALVATPCTAPFMATAIAYAITQPMPITILGFAALGFGLALPFLLLSYFPILSYILPKPGVWMEKCKEALAFPMYITAAWLIWVFSKQANSDDTLMLLIGTVIFAFAIWLWQQSKSRVAHMFAVIILAGSVFIAAPSSNGPDEKDVLDGEPYSDQRLDELKATGRPVFVYFSADWCITCKVNEQISLFTADNRTLVAERNIAVLKGDWTNRNEMIARVLARHNRMGVPLYLYYPSGVDKPVILPEILSPTSITDVFRDM